MGLVDGIFVGVLVLVLAWILLAGLIWLYRPSRELAGPAILIIPALVRLVRSLLADPATPRSVKVALVGLLAYLVSPIDLIPDFIPVLGSVDDLAISALVLRWAGRKVGMHDLRAHWTGSPEGFDLLARLLGI